MALSFTVLGLNYMLKHHLFLASFLSLLNQCIHSHASLNFYPRFSINQIFKTVIMKVIDFALALIQQSPKLNSVDVSYGSTYTSGWLRTGILISKE